MRYAAVIVALTACVLDNERPPDEPTEPDPPAGGRQLFVTRGTYSGALTSYVGLDDGLAAGDAICQLRAKAAGLTGTWIAWLSGPQADAIDRLSAQGPWQLIGAGVAFENRAQLYGEPLIALDRDERGTSLPEPAVWSGTRAGGLKHTDNCDGWTTGTGSAWGLAGRKSTTFLWTDWGSDACFAERHLVCFQN